MFWQRMINIGAKFEHFITVYDMPVYPHRLLICTCQLKIKKLITYLMVPDRFYSGSKIVLTADVNLSMLEKHSGGKVFQNLEVLGKK